MLAVPAKKAARAGAKIIVIDSRETEMTRYATEWIKVRPGTEHISSPPVWLANDLRRVARSPTRPVADDDSNDV